MQFEWDEAKRQSNIHKHGFDFVDAIEVFENVMVTLIDERQDYAESRYIAIGVAKGRIVVVIYTDRDETIRIISFRKALKHEREFYFNQITN